jgi:predicted alpha/beta hydrolase
MANDNLALTRHGTGDPLRARQELQLAAEDGFGLGATLFSPRGRARGTIVIHGAAAVPQTYYARFAQHLTRQGLRVVTYDYRGVGRSRPTLLAGFEATMTEWARCDARAVMRYALGQWDEPVALVGHSFGGQLMGLIDEARQARGALLVGTQLGWFGHWSGLERLKLAAIWRALIPALTTVYGFLPGSAGLGTDLPAGVARQWARWCSDPDYLMSEHPEARERFARFDHPVVLYSFTDDRYAPLGAVEHFVRVLSGADLEHRRVDPRELGVADIGHFGFFRGASARTLWREADDVLNALISGDVPMPPRSPRPLADEFGFDYDEVLADLQFGRA